MRIIRIAVASVAALTAAIALAGPAAAAHPAPKLDDPSVTGSRLAERFLGLLKAKDVAGLTRFLAPNFQLQRADGSGDTKGAYLGKLPTVNEFVVTDAVGTQSGDSLVVRYLANVEGMINGKAYRPGPAPRLSTFRWDGRRWQLTSHANFNPLQSSAS
jgi:hypothetical protein